MLDIPENQTRMIQQQHIVKDITNTMYEYTLDVNGFQFIKHQTQLKPHEFGNPAKVKSNYEPESIDLIKKMYVEKGSSCQNSCTNNVTVQTAQELPMCSRTTMAPGSVQRIRLATPSSCPLSMCTVTST